MSDNFSWHTDEDEGWDEPTPKAATPLPRRRWHWLLGIAAAAILISTVLYLRLQQQVQTATATAQEDLLAAHQLSQQAAATNDLDLFRSNLSRRDPEWADTQRALILAGLFLDRSAFGLRWWGETELNLTDAAATPTLPITVTFSPDLLSAELVYEQEYLLVESDSVSQTVRLQQTAVYRRGGGRWLRADPLPEFWGALHTAERAHLTLTYSQRDEPIAPRLADDLNSELERLCTTLPSLNCPPDLHLEMRLTRDPASFFSLVTLEDTLMADDEIILPAPTLIGLPVDETGYELLLNGYAAHLVAAAITQLIPYECCHHGYYYHAFMDKQLSQLGLRAWPMNPATYATLDPEQFEPFLSRFWGRGSLDYSDLEDLPYLYSLVDYLTEGVQPNLTPLDWLREILPGVSYTGWLENVLPDNPGLYLFNTRWRGYIYRQQHPQPDLPVSLPTGTIQMSCNSEAGLPTVYSHDLRSGEWSERFLSSEFYEPVLGGYITQRVPSQLLFVNAADQSTVIMEVGSPNSVFSPNYFYTDYFASPPPAELFNFVTYQVTANATTQMQNWLTDLDSCKLGDCQTRPLPGTPIWSPGGQYFIAYADEGSDELNNNLFLSDRSALDFLPIDTGYLPFWLDETHYGYFKINETAAIVEMWVGEVNDTPPRVHLTTEDVMPLLPSATNDFVYLAWVVPRPQSTSHEALMVAISNSEDPLSQGQYTHLSVQWDDNWETVQAIEVQRTLPHTGLPLYSPNDQFMVVLEQKANEAFLYETSITFINQTTQAEQTYSVGQFRNFPVWSENGEWLINVSDVDILLINPAHQTEWRIPHEFNFCNRHFYVPQSE
ncbi:MAG: hypothetical protein IPL78_14790 [Chloroflexi bacterium]|nr:hypothetical protein [Chloroflexota bacterium]